MIGTVACVAVSMVSSVCLAATSAASFWASPQWLQTNWNIRVETASAAAAMSCHTET